MLALAFMTVVSIIGRSTIGVSVEGDYELVEAGLGIAVFLFLPECYVKQGHVVVDLFTAHCRLVTIRRLEAISDLLFTLVAVVLVWRMSLSGLEAYDYMEQSMILELPLWWVYAVGILSLVVMGLCSLNNLYIYLFRRLVR
ncbi:TRAP transporter small permease [Marinobacterium ramblicola]|uniref:TRAP transporter small permease n=1 Tax=Marinobacterium ramblicola TaxID=2849041 RepID=UPI001FE8EE5A|nr:TRAP transporter small permease [Marinobacterium ramblicola]